MNKISLINTTGMIGIRLLSDGYYVQFANFMASDTKLIVNEESAGCPLCHDTTLIDGYAEEKINYPQKNHI